MTVIFKGEPVPTKIGYWSLGDEGEPKDKTKASPKGKSRTIICTCVCGEVRQVRIGKMLSGNSKHCGCKNAIPPDPTTHGDYKSRLYRCYNAMKNRCKDRDGCSWFNEWDDYTKFREWSLANGYKDDLLLCRNGDTGDYTPDNCRWDTRQSNNEEAFAKIYKFIDPNGNPISIYNMSRFCRDTGLSVSNMRRVNNGEQSHHHGWTRYTSTEEV